MFDQSPAIDTCSSTNTPPSRASSEDPGALAIDLDYSPTWSLLAESTTSLFENPESINNQPGPSLVELLGSGQFEVPPRPQDHFQNIPWPMYQSEDSPLCNEGAPWVPAPYADKQVPEARNQYRRACDTEGLHTPSPPPLDDQDPPAVVPKYPVEERREETLVCHQGHSDNRRVFKSVLRTLLTGESTTPYEYCNHQPVMVQPLDPPNGPRSHFPQQDMGHGLLCENPAARPVQQLMSFERAFWQIGLPKMGCFRSQIPAPPPLPAPPPPPIPQHVPQPIPQPSKGYFIVYPVNQQFIGFPTDKPQIQHIDLTIPSQQEIEAPCFKKRRYTTVRELLQARTRPLAPNTDHQPPMCPNHREDFLRFQCAPTDPNARTIETRSLTRKRSRDAADCCSGNCREPAAQAPPSRTSNRLAVKEHRPRHFDLQVLEIGTFKMNRIDGNGFKSKFKIIFTRRKFLYEFCCGADRKAAVVDVAFDSIVALFAERDVLLVEVNSMPRLTHTGCPKHKMSDLSGGQLATCFLHRLVLGKPVTDKVKTYLTDFDSRFDVLLGAKLSVPLLLQEVHASPINPSPLPPCPPPTSKETPYKPGTVEPNKDTCHCQTSCRSLNCPCIKTGTRCDRYADGCGCTVCNNPFNTFTEMGLEVAGSSVDPCLVQSVRQMTGQMLSVVLEDRVLPNCCKVPAKVKDMVPGKRRCPNPGCPLKPLFQFSWCARVLCREDEHPRNHCHLCHSCRDNQTKHCQTCKKCVKTSGILGLYCSECEAYCGRDPSAIFDLIPDFSSTTPFVHLSPPTEISD